MGAHLLGKGQAAGVEHGLHPLVEQALLFGPTGRGQDAGTAAAGHLQGRLADAAGARMDQHRFPRLELGQVHQSVEGREEDRAEAGAGFAIEPGWQGDAELGAAADMAGQAAHGQGRQHPLADQGRIHAGSHRHHPADALAAKGHLGPLGQAQLLPVGRQQAQGIEHVAEIQARGLHGQLQLAIHQGGWRQGSAHQGFEAAGVATHKAEAFRRQPSQPLAMGLARTPEQARFVACLAPELVPVPGLGLELGVGGEVQLGPGQLGGFQGGRLGKARQHPAPGIVALQHEP